MSEPANFPIRNWSEDDRPREKLLLKGKASLSDAELIAILISSGYQRESAVQLSKRILAHCNNSLNELGKLSATSLMSFKGIGEAKALSIIAALELGRRRRELISPVLHKIVSSQSIYELMCPILGELPHEEFWIVLLNNSNEVLGKLQLSRGGITGTVVDVRLVFKHAIEAGATSLILCHNHPSGTLVASEADKQITSKIKEAGNHLDIKVLDHLIITERAYLSFADEGIL